MKSYDFEDYEKASKNYDLTRGPVGLEIILGCLCTSKTPLNKINLMSVGCGTGNYEVELSKYVKSVCGTDISEGMIEQARKKAKDIPNLEFRTEDAMNLSISSESFDAIIFNQSLHHTGSHNNQVKALKEAYRILKSGRRIIIQTISQDQFRNSYWYFSLIPKAVEIQIPKFLPISELMKNLVEIGFNVKGRIIPLDIVLQGKKFFDIEGPLKDEWRAGASIWNLVSDEELKQVQEKVKEMIKKDEMVDYVAKLDELRKQRGQITFVYADKP